jgi:diaminohydroxyphosphoribosylaminopyrimidine deaminase/5-amino-6-(5-phosphoribosylamino)uracil reductase
MNDNLFMQRCLDIAQLAAGLNSPNPYVGSVIVQNDIIIGEGWHKKYGDAHAEVNAINAVSDKSLLINSTIYVSLEPCFHFGKTPPCVDLILKYKIPRVVIGSRDPYYEVAGRSIEKLREAGVEVVVGVLEKEQSWLNRRFFTNVEKKRPYITLKYAVSSDGFIGRKNEKIQISGPLSKYFVHKLRASEAAIMVGTETASCDNPQLNLRHYFGQQPVRIVLDKRLRLADNLHLFDGKQKTIVFTESEKKSATHNLDYIAVDFNSKNFLQNVLEELQIRKISSILIEGGARLLHSFIINNLWDEAFILRSKTKKINFGISAPLIQASLCRNLEQLGQDQIEHYINEER